MSTTSLRRAFALASIAVSVPLAGGLSASTQAPPRWDGVPFPTLSEGVFPLATADEPDLRVRVMATGLSHPWSLAFLPDGGILVTERDGRLRIVRDGMLDPDPVDGLPEVGTTGQFMGLLEVALHPDFERNRWVYYTYRTADEVSLVALARARFDGASLDDSEILFTASGAPFTTSSGSRLLFAPDGTLFMPVGGAPGPGPSGLRAQDPNDHSGKILRLNDDGTVPPDNPFVGRAGYLPEIYALGTRNPMGLAFHPVTGELWAVEHGLQGGDEINVIRPGRNYGWPVVSLGREYTGPRASDAWAREGMEDPVVVWIPSIAPSGLMFYTGDRFPAWQGDLFVGAMIVGRVPRTGRLERVILNEAGQEIGRESILSGLGQRIRDVRQGPDGLIYLLTDEENGALLRIEPV